MSTMFWIWMATAVIFLILELATPTLIFACFVIGSIASGIFAYFSPEGYYWQIGLFLIVSAVLLPLTRSIAKKITKESPQKSNIDALIGKIGLVTKAIDPDLGGQIMIEGESWRAVSSQAITEGSKVRVLSYSGTKLAVELVEGKTV
jgi:membrane protein implicated in regulation of membrane protease activity